MLGRLKFRTSYGQNVLAHSVECANLAAMMADELGANAKTARRAALLHDIGKAVSHEVEGPHALVGGDLARRHGETEAVAHAMEAHHNEVEPQTIEAVIVQSADALSGARPGARGESLEQYVKRLRELEQIATRHEGVEKVYAMQAGREIRVMVAPDALDDDGALLLSREIAREIERELEYPGQIKVTVIRESRAVEYVRDVARGATRRRAASPARAPPLAAERSGDARLGGLGARHATRRSTRLRRRSRVQRERRRGRSPPAAGDLVRAGGDGARASDAGQPTSAPRGRNEPRRGRRRRVPGGLRSWPRSPRLLALEAQDVPDRLHVVAARRAAAATRRPRSSGRAGRRTCRSSTSEPDAPAQAGHVAQVGARPRRPRPGDLDAVGTADRRAAGRGAAPRRLRRRESRERATGTRARRSSASGSAVQDAARGRERGGSTRARRRGSASGRASRGWPLDERPRADGRGSHMTPAALASTRRRPRARRSRARSAHRRVRRVLGRSGTARGREVAQRGCGRPRGSRLVARWEQVTASARRGLLGAGGAGPPTRRQQQRATQRGARRARPDATVAVPRRGGDGKPR